MVKGQKVFEAEMLTKYSNVCEPKDGWQRLAADVFEVFGLKALIRREFSQAVKGQFENALLFAEQTIREKVEKGEGLPNWPWQVEKAKAWFNELGNRRKVLTALYGLDGANLERATDLARRENLEELQVMAIRKSALRHMQRNLEYSRPRLTTWADVSTRLDVYSHTCKDLRASIEEKNQHIRELERVKARFEALKTHLKEVGLIVSEPKKEEEPTEQDVETHDRVLDYRVDDLGFDVRTYNCLKREGIETLGDLLLRTESDLLGIRNFGHQSMNQVKGNLKLLGLSLKEPEFQIDDEELDIE